VDYTLVHSAWLQPGRRSRIHIIHIWSRKGDESSTAAPADLATLAAGCARFFRRPLVRGPFFMRRTAALAGNLTLLVGRHRSKSAAFFSNSVHSILLVVSPRSGMARGGFRCLPSRIGSHEAKGR
jgi:hypothetical protein